MSHTRSTKKKSDTHIISHLAGASGAGLAELSTFHPIDTVVKRLQNHRGEISSYNEVIFKDASQSGPVKKIGSLYSGFGPAFVYKMSQRVYKYTAQPLIKDALDNHFGENVEARYGTRKKEVFCESVGGALTGVGEAIALTPVDSIKIRYQTNKPTEGFFPYLMKDPLKIFRGTVPTIMRNAPGSFALFGASSFANTYILKLSDPKKATLFQDAFSSSCGSFASVVVASPVDVVKTRIQACSGAKNGRTIFFEMLANESLTAFAKGLGIKSLTIVPKVAFSFTLAKQITKKVDNGLKNFGFYSPKSDANKADTATQNQKLKPGGGT